VNFQELLSWPKRSSTRIKGFTSSGRHLGAGRHVVPHWAKGIDEPIRVHYDVGLGREFAAEELLCENRWASTIHGGELAAQPDIVMNADRLIDCPWPNAARPCSTSAQVPTGFDVNPLILVNCALAMTKFLEIHDEPRGALLSPRLRPCAGFESSGFYPVFVESPCIKVCVYDRRGELCSGCVALWTKSPTGPH